MCAWWWGGGNVLYSAGRCCGGILNCFVFIFKNFYWLYECVVLFCSGKEGL